MVASSNSPREPKLHAVPDTVPTTPAPLLLESLKRTTTFWAASWYTISFPRTFALANMVSLPKEIEVPDTVPTLHLPVRPLSLHTTTTFCALASYATSGQTQVPTSNSTAEPKLIELLLASTVPTNALPLSLPWSSLKTYTILGKKSGFCML